MIKIAVTGGRDHRLTQQEREDLAWLLRDGFKDKHVVLLHGDCEGVDLDAAAVAIKLELEVVAYPAREYGDWPQCGPIRNAAMIKDADVLIAFRGGKGTADCCRKAHRKGIPTLSLPAKRFK